MARPEDDEVMENESAIPEPPAGEPDQVARAAWQVAWSASNAAAGYHASIINHLVAHEKSITAELRQMRAELSKDFASFRSALIESLKAVGIRIDLSPSGEHARVEIVEAGPGRDRVASSHDLEEGLAEVGDRIEELRDLRVPGSSVPSERVRAMLSEERAAIEAHFESEQRIMRLEVEKKQLELARAADVQRLTDQSKDLAETNTRWWRLAFMFAGGFVTVLVALLVWAITKQPPSVAP